MKGGYRAGAGRKRGFSALEAEKAREYIVQEVSASLEPIVSSLIKQAKNGSINAAKELLDRAYGRIPQTREIMEELSQEPISIVVIRAMDSSLPQYKNSLQIPEELAIKNGLIPSEHVLNN